MQPSEMTIGRRVKIARTIDVYPLGVFEAGLTGTVTDHSVDPHGETLVEVTLDLHRPELDAWDNVLQVYGEQTPQCTADNFEPQESNASRIPPPITLA